VSTENNEQRTLLADRPEWSGLYIAWRARYQQSRNIVEKAMKTLQSLDVSYPALFDETTEDGQKRLKQILVWVDDGDYGQLKAFIDHWKPILLEAARDKLREAKRKEIHAL